jgi:hypothetical protein
VVRGVGEQPEEAVLADHLAHVVDPLDRDVVQVVGPVHSGPGIRLGQDQALPVPGPGPHLGRQRGEGCGACLVVPQDPQAGPGQGQQRHPIRPVHQVVLPVAEEGEVVVGQPAQQRHGLGGGPGAFRGQPVSQPGGLRLHPRVVLDRDPDIVQHPVQVLFEPGGGVAGGRAVGGRAVAAWAADLDVGPGLGDFVVIAVPGGECPAHVVQRPRHVPADQQLGMQDVVAVQAMPGQFHGHRIDQERHVVSDDVDHTAAWVERAWRTRGPHPDQGPALRPAGGEPGLLQRGRGDGTGPGRGQVLDGDVPVVRPEIAEQVPDVQAGRFPGADRLGRLG